MTCDPAPPVEVCFLQEVPLDVVRAAPVVIDHLVRLRSRRTPEFSACAQRFQTSVSALDCLIYVGITRRHVSLVRRAALYFGVDTGTGRALERETYGGGKAW